MAKRGRPGSISYADVEGATLRLLADGKRPTLRAVREQLGGVGSLQLIQRHLATWEAERARSQASDPFSVSAADVEALAPADFAALINHLVRLEARQQDIPAVPDTTMRINDADGGIDGMLSWRHGPKRTRRLPAREFVWQSKSGKRLAPSDLVREMMRRDGAELKPRIREVLAAGGAYVVFSALDMTADQKLTRVHAMKAAARPQLEDIDPLISIVAADEIAAWAAEDLWSRTFLIRAAGREHTSLLATFDEWASQPGFDNPYVWNDVTEGIAERIRDAAKKPGSVFRLNGAPGLGKTRLVLEALRSLSEDGFGIVYFDARYTGSGLQLLSSIPDWRRLGVGGIIVVDDCELNLHNQVSKAIVGTGMSAITIDFHPELLVDATLRQTSSETINKIVQGFTPAPSVQNALRIVEYAQGWPLMAILVLKAMRNERFAIADLTNDELTQRLIGHSEDSDQYAILSLLALFDHVGCLERVQSEWEELRSTFLPTISHDAFHRIVKRFERSGLVVAIGRYWRVTPPPLALRLTRRWLDEASPEARERLFTGLPEQLTESLARRFGEVTTETSVALSAELLGSAGRFGSFDGIIGRTNAKIFRALAGVNPGAAIGALTRVFTMLTDGDLMEIDESKGRQSLVWALEAIAFHAEFFTSAALLLFDLARNENASHSNNAGGTLCKFFSVNGSQTEAPPEQRIAVLAQMLKRDDDESYRLVARALSRVLSISPNTVVLGVESQGGRPSLIEWHPTIYKDIFDYVRSSLNIALELSTRSSTAFDLARDVVADGIPLLIRYRLFDELERATAPLIGRAWPKAVDRLKWSIRHNLKEEDYEGKKRATSVLEALTPTDFSEQVKLFVSSPPHDLEYSSTGSIDRTAENIERFAAMTIEQNRVREVFDIISTGWQHRMPHAYGHAVAKLSLDKDAVVSAVLDAYRAASEPRNDLALMAVLGSVGESDPARRSAILRQMFDDKKLVQALPAAVVWPRAAPEDIDLLTQAYTEERISEQPRANLFMGRAYENVDEERIRALAEVFLSKGWRSSVIAMLTFGILDKGQYDDIFKRVILDSKFVSEEMDDIHEWSLFEITKRLVTDDCGFALAIAEQMFDLALSDDGDFGARRRVADLWPLLLAHDSVWKAFKERYSSLEYDGRWRLLIATQHDSLALAEDRLAVERRSTEDLIAFANENEDVPRLLAQYALMVDGENDGALRITPLMMALLENFGERDDVLRSIEANIHSFLSVGPRAAYYAMRVDLVNQIPSFGRARIEVWKQELRANLEAELRRASLRDEEMDKGIF